MKKIKTASLLKIAVCGLMLMSITPLAMAETNVELDQLVPSTIDQLVEFNTSSANPFTGTIASLLDTILRPDAVNDQTLKTIFTEELKSNKVTLALKNKMVKLTDSDYSYLQSGVYMSMHMSTDNYSKLITILTSTPSTLKTETINGVTVYNPGTGNYITMAGNLVLMATSRDQMITALDNYTKNQTSTLAQNSDYMAVRAKDLQNSFLNLYINPAQYSEIMTSGSGTITSTPSINSPELNSILTAGKNIVGAMKAEGISLAQSTNGYTFGIIVKGDNAKLTQLNLNFDKYNFVPELYKYVNSQNVMMFEEQSSLQKKFQDLFGIFFKDASLTKSFSDWKIGFKQESGVDFDTELLPLFSGKYSISLHKTNNIYPAITLMFDVKNMKGQATAVLAKLVGYLDKTLAKAVAGGSYVHTTSTLNGGNFDVMKFDPSSTQTAPAELKSLDHEKTLITIQAGITNEGFLIFTNATNLADVYVNDGKGMMGNSTFNQSFISPNESAVSVAFMSFDNIKNYATLLMDTFNTKAEVRDLVNGFLAPWHDVYAKVYATSDTAWGTGFVNVDNAGLVNYGQLFSKISKMQAEEAAAKARALTPPKKFCDVSANDWFANDVNALANKKIINGYSDGCFRPEKEVSRGEFVRMAMQSYNNGETVYKNSRTAYFKDTSVENLNTSMYSPLGILLDVNEAASRGYVKGYDDGKFHPERKITRGEAVQILHNFALHESHTSWSENFNDVHETDWFHTAVVWAFNKKIIAGTSAATFEPGRFMTRAEAARVINLFSNISPQNDALLSATVQK